MGIYCIPEASTLPHGRAKPMPCAFPRLGQFHPVTVSRSVWKLFFFSWPKRIHEINENYLPHLWESSIFEFKGAHLTFHLQTGPSSIIRNSSLSFSLCLLLLPSSLFTLSPSSSLHSLPLSFLPSFSVFLYSPKLYVPEI